MEFSSISDRFIHLTYYSNDFNKKISPIKLNADHEAYIGLSEFSYTNNINEYNFPGAKLGVYGSKYTNDKWLPIEFILGNYNTTTLCEEINQRIKSVLPSTFNDWQLNFRLNSLTNRVEISVDGDKAIVPENELFSTIIQQPLSYLLGFTEKTSTDSFIFGCQTKNFPPPEKYSHAIADFRPKLDFKTNFFYICMKSFEIDSISYPFFPNLLATVEKDNKNIEKTVYISKKIDNILYVPIAQNVRNLNSIDFRLYNEKGETITFHKKAVVKIVLHLVNNKKYKKI